MYFRVYIPVNQGIISEFSRLATPFAGDVKITLKLYPTTVPTSKAGYGAVNRVVVSLKG
jgi:hypothetical protein